MGLFHPIMGPFYPREVPPPGRVWSAPGLTMIRFAAVERINVAKLVL